MSKMKHNKKRNTLFLYEVLIRDLTKSIIEENNEDKKKIINILKKYFSKGKLLFEEIKLYKILSETTGLKEQPARRLLNEVFRVYHNFGTSNISKEQEKLSSEMSKDLRKDIFMTYVPNYRNLATIYQLFNRKMNPKQKIILEEKVIDSLISPKEKKEEDNNNFKEIDNLSFRLFIESFNEAYSNKLLKEQQELLSKYVLSCVDNGVELKIYLNEEIGRLKEIIQQSILKEDLIKNDNEMLEKTKEVLNILEEFKNNPELNILMLENILRIQKLTKEIVEEN